MLSLSYAINSLAWNHKDASATTSPPGAADYACDGTASDTVLPICLNDMVENYLYDEEEVATAVVAWKNVRTAANTTTKANFLTYIRTLRGDKRFRLESQYWGKY